MLRMEGNLKKLGNFMANNAVKYKRRPRYTVVLHDVREKMGISLNTYVIVDSVHKLSTSNPKFPIFNTLCDTPKWQCQVALQ